MHNKPLFVTLEPIQNRHIMWNPYVMGDIIYGRFSQDEWHKIADDIDSETELCELLIQYPHMIQGFVLYDKYNNEPIAFAYLLKESKNKTVSFHGGGWGKSTRLTMLYMQGTMLLIEHLLQQGYKVRTYCAVDNLNAYRFMNSLGFVRYRTTQQKIYQWINLKRLYKSAMYNYLQTR